MRFEQISAAQVCDGVLSEFTTLLVPGGFAPNIERALGDAGAEAIRAFVRSGGGFVGICAGAFLGSAWGLGLLPVELADASDRCWDRGEGVLKLRFSEVEPAPGHPVPVPDPETPGNAGTAGGGSDPACGD